VRLVFLTLVVLNLGFLAWSRWIDVPVTAAVRAKPGETLPTLQLVSAAPAPAPGPAPIPATKPPASIRCRSIGPFDDTAVATAASERLRAHGWQPRERDAEGQVLDGYWVYLSDLKDPAALRSALARLSAAGIHDATAVNVPPQTDRVSVGFFADQAHAVRRAEQVRALGFKPTLDVHQRTANQHWVDFELKPEEPEPNATDVLGGDPAANASAGVPQLIPCPAGSAGG
jgi:hypothetical protein